MAKPRSIGNPHGYPDWTFPMIWVLQDGELWPIEQWVARQGVAKHWRVAGNIGDLANLATNVYTVPANKVLYVSYFNFSAADICEHQLRFGSPSQYIADVYLLGNTPVVAAVTPPVIIPAGDTLVYHIWNQTHTVAQYRAVIHAYELDV
jgi:hypothetical protein